MEPNVQAQPSPLKLDGPIVLFRSAWETFKANWKVLTPIAILPTVLFMLGEVFGFLKSPVSILLSVILSIAGFVFSVAMQGALLTAIRRVQSEPGAQLALKDQYKIGFTFFWSMLLIMIISILCFLGSVVLLVIPGIIFVIYASLAVYARVFDGKKGFEAFVESYRLIKGRWWAVFGRTLFLILTYIVAAIIVGLVFGLLKLILGIDAHSVGSAIVGIIVNLILAAFFGTLAPIYLMRIYDSLKQIQTATPEGGTFKGWLIAFLIIGIIAIVVVPILVTLIFAGMAIETLRNVNNLNYNGIPFNIDLNGISTTTISTSSVSTSTTPIPVR